MYSQVDAVETCGGTSAPSQAAASKQAHMVTAPWQSARLGGGWEIPSVMEEAPTFGAEGPAARVQLADYEKPTQKVNVYTYVCARVCTLWSHDQKTVAARSLLPYA